MSGTLGARLAELDRRGFVGRRVELGFLERCLEAGGPASIVHVHGPGGIGKSTLLRELARRAEQAGRPVHVVEGRDLPPTPDALDAAVASAAGAARPLVLLDSYEFMAGLDGHLRRSALPTLPADSVVVIAGRRPPDPGWFRDGWERITVDIELGGLAPAEALALLREHGLSDEGHQREVINWAEGSPLALTLAADAAAATVGEWAPIEGTERPEIVRALLTRIVEGEQASPHFWALTVAAVARATTVELLADVRQGQDAEAPYEWLRTRPFVEPLGEGVTVHELVRRALRADLRRRDPERERLLRRRIVDHLYAQARAGDILKTIDMAHLVENEAIRWGYSWRGSARYRVDDVRAGDGERVAARLAALGFGHWWEPTRVWFERAPERVAVARDADDEVVGYLIAVTVSNAPEWASEDAVIGRWLADARRRAGGEDAVIWRDAIDFVRDPGAEVRGMLGMAGILRSGRLNPRYAYLPVNPHLEGAVAFAGALGAQHIAELDLDYAGVKIHCCVADYGPGGLLAAQRNVVYGELGLKPPESGVQNVPGAQPPGGAEFTDAVRDALRDLRLPHRLAASPLATGEDPDARAESVRVKLREAAENAFGDTPNEELLQRVLIRGYIDPAPSHELAAHELNLSRAAYFRRLRTAAERVAEHLAARS